MAVHVYLGQQIEKKPDYFFSSSTRSQCLQNNAKVRGSCGEALRGPDDECNVLHDTAECTPMTVTRFTIERLDASGQRLKLDPSSTLSYHIATARAITFTCCVALRQWGP